MKYWLFKSEPDVFGIDDLAALPSGTDSWDGIRNYQARNFMRDDMRVGDLGFFYHSRCDPPGIVGVVEVVREAYPDHTARDPDSGYYDPKATVDNPRWMMVDVAFRERFDDIVPLAELKTAKALADMVVVQKGSRLSITPVTAGEWKHVLGMAERGNARKSS